MYLWLTAVEVEPADGRERSAFNSLLLAEFFEAVVGVRQVVRCHVVDEGARDFVVADAEVEPAQRSRDAGKDYLLRHKQRNGMRCAHRTYVALGGATHKGAGGAPTLPFAATSSSAILARMAEKDASFFSFARRPRVADDANDNDGRYIVTLRGNLERAPVDAVDPQSVFSAERALKANEISGGVVIPEPRTDAYSPYAAAWKEFDKLEKLAKKGGAFGWIHWGWGSMSGVASLFDPHRHTKRVEQALFVAVCMVAVFTMVRARYAASRVTHWPCPRCHTEWPGTKTEKDPQCAMCGLKLHQMAP